MNIQAEVSLYPLGDGEYSERIDAFIENLNNAGLEIEVGRLSSLVSGECSDIFRILSDAFEEDSELGPAVMVLKVSNISPSD